MLAPGGVRIGETTWLQPDVAVYAEAPFPARSWEEAAVPVLVAEVLSPSTRERDRYRKRPVYLQHGVTEVWLVDTDSRAIERWTSASEFPETLRGSFVWSPMPSLPTLRFGEHELFGPAQ